MNSISLGGAGALVLFAIIAAISVPKNKILHAMVFSGSIGGLALSVYEPSLRNVVIFSVAVFALIIALLRTFPRDSGESGKKPHLPFLALPFLMMAFWALIRALYGDFNAAAVLFHIRHGFVSGGLPLEHAKLVALFLAFAFCLMTTWYCLIRANRLMQRLDRFAVLPLLVLNPLTFSVVEASGFSFDEKIDLAAYYQADGVRPQAKTANRPNLIYIYLESAERTYGDRTEFGPVLDPFEPYLRRGLVATGIDQIEGTGWTMAGQVSSGCGVPLVTPWLELRGVYGGEERFMPGVRCLSDYLTEAGYHVAFAKAASLAFAGTRTFLETHGYRDAVGRDELRDLYPRNPTEWGIDDEALLDWSYHRIVDLASRNQPYAFTLVTLGGHGPDGVLSRACRDGEVPVAPAKGILQGLECTNRLVARMLEHLERDGLLANAVVVLQSDHLAMGNTVSDRLVRYRRRNLFLAFGAGVPARVVDRPASMIDVYPTVLELMGFTLPERKAGLGVSLLSDEPTLFERLGGATLDRAIRRDWDLRNRFWNADV